MNSKGLKTGIIFIGCLFICRHEVIAQERPPVPVTINTISSIDFGKLVTGNGSLTVPSDGSAPFTSGNVFIMPQSIAYPALFQIQANPGYVLRININNGNSFNLSGSQGGSLSCSLSGAFINGSNVPHNNVFITQQGSQYTNVTIGGTLNIGSTQPTGTYNGSFFITVIME